MIVPHLTSRPRLGLIVAAAIPDFPEFIHPRRGGGFFS